MKIAIDATAAYSDRAGISRLMEGIIEGFKETGAEHSITIYSRKELPVILTSNMRVELIPPVRKLLGGGIIWYWKVAKDMKDRDCDVLISGDMNIAPLFIPNVLQIINDLSPLDFPKSYSIRHVVKYWLLLKLAINRSKWLVAISEHTKNRLINRCNVRRQICTMPLGIDEWVTRVLPNEEEKEIKDRYHLPNEYLLSVSTLQPRKNYVNMIKAFASLAPTRSDLKYIIVGKKGWYYEEIFQVVKDLKLQDRVVFLGFVPDDELNVVMKNAKAILYVSKDEGFGFPAVQAAIKRVPVVLADIPVFRELMYSDSFIYVNPNSIEEISAGIRAAIASKPGEVSEEFKDYYSWKNTALTLLSIVAKE